MSASPTSRSALPEPAWEIAHLFPQQGRWRESDFLEATRTTNRLVELIDGHVRVLPMPSTTHQRIVRFLVQLLLQFVSERDLGEVLFAPLRVRIKPGSIREPDIVFMLRENADRAGEAMWDGADLAIEVVSDDPESRQRDWEEKRLEYAEAGIREYWVVDPQRRIVAVFTLSDGERQYAAPVVSGVGEVAASVLLRGFVVEVDALLRAAERR